MSTPSRSFNLAGTCLAVALAACAASPAAAKDTAQWAMGDVTVTTSSPSSSSSVDNKKKTSLRLAATLSDHHAAVHSSCAVGVPVEPGEDDGVPPTVFWTGACETKVEGKTVTGTWDGVVRALVQYAPAKKNSKKTETATASEKEPWFSIVTLADAREVDATSGVTTLKSTVEVKYYPGATNEHPPCDMETALCATDKDTTFVDGELVISQTFDAAGAKLSERPALSLFANVDKDGEPLPSGAEYEEVDVASGGYVVPLMYVSENKKAVDAGDSSRKKILGGQHFLWGEPEVTGDLTLMEYDVNPATRATEPFFDRVYFAVKATDTFGNDVERVATLTVQELKDDKSFKDALVDAHDGAAAAANAAAAAADVADDGEVSEDSASVDAEEDEDITPRVVLSRRALRH